MNVQGDIQLPAQPYDSNPDKQKAKKSRSRLIWQIWLIHINSVTFESLNTAMSTVILQLDKVPVKYLLPVLRDQVAQDT